MWWIYPCSIVVLHSSYLFFDVVKNFYTLVTLLKAGISFKGCPFTNCNLILHKIDKSLYFNTRGHFCSIGLLSDRQRKYCVRIFIVFKFMPIVLVLLVLKMVLLCCLKGNECPTEERKEDNRFFTSKSKLI